MPTTPKSLLDELEAELGLTAEQRQSLSANPALVEKLTKGNELYDFYLGLDSDEDDTAAAKAKEVAAEKAVAAEKSRVAAAAAAAAAAAKSTSSGSTSLSGDLASIEALFEKKFEEFGKKFVPMEKVQEFRQDIIASALKLSDQYASIRENHRAEFREPLKQEEFETFVTAQQNSGTKYATLTKAYDDFIRDKRMEAEVDKRVKESVKQRESAAAVPGQTPASGMSPARAQIAKARATSASSGDNTSSMEKAVAKLREMNRGREDTVAE